MTTDPPSAASTEASGSGARWRRRSLIVLLAPCLAAALMFLLFTDAGPRVAAPPAPDAEQVAAARAAAEQLRDETRDRAGVSTVRFDRRQMRAIGALASNAFRPDRLSIAARGDRVAMSGSHTLFLGRWLNAAVETRGTHRGFPPVRLTIGGIPLPAILGRPIFGAIRIVLNLRGARIPPLDDVFRSVSTADGAVTVRLRLPRESSLVQQLTGASPETRSATLARYCRLAREQAADPAPAFVDQVHRAFAARGGDGAAAQGNRAAIMALAMLVVDPKVGELAGLRGGDVDRCRIPVVAVELNGRDDLPKHWALSAALEIGTGMRLSQAMGEWKELADSVSRRSEFAVGDPSGFSFVDLSADRAGFLTARAAVDDATASDMSARLARIAARDLLPPELMALDEGLGAADFARRYGSVDDPRFAAAVERIDSTLRAAMSRR